MDKTKTSIYPGLTPESLQLAVQMYKYATGGEVLEFRVVPVLLTAATRDSAPGAFFCADGILM